MYANCENYACENDLSKLQKVLTNPTIKKNLK